MSHPSPARPVLGDAGPSQGSAFLLVMARETPLTLDELSSLRRAAETAPLLPDLEIDAIEGFGQVRVRVAFAHPGARRLMEALEALPSLLHALARAAPRCKVRVSDPAALLSWTGSRFCLDPMAARALPGLRDGYAVPASALLERLVAPPSADTPLPAAPDCAADLLQALARGGVPADVASAAAGLDDARLLEFVGGRVLPGPAARLLASRGALPAEIAAALIHDGDALEREAAGSNHASRAASESVAPPALEPGAVISFGRLLLSRPGLSSTDDEEDDDLLLLEEEEEGSDPLQLAITDLADHDTVAAAAGVAGAPGYPRRLLSRLSGFNDSATGACALICLGAWTAEGVPGVTSALHAIAADSERPWALRALALRASVASGRPDARSAVLQSTADEDARVAAAALRLCGALPGADARKAVRAALDRPATRPFALAAAAAAADPAARESALEAARDEDPNVRAAAAMALPRIAGLAALETLRALHSDPSWEVRRAAGSAIARIGNADDISEAMEMDDAALHAAFVKTLGEADRTDAWPRLLAASRHARPVVRAAAAGALSALRLPAATPHLCQLVNDANPTVRVAALRGLGESGDRRGVHALRRHAGAGGPVGDAAAAALTTGRTLRQPAPDGRIRMRVRGPLADGTLQEVSNRLSTAGLSVNPRGDDLVATGTVDPDDVPRLNALCTLLAEVDAATPGLEWSVRDGQYALRRMDGCWVVSGRRGIIARDAGWFDDPPPVPVDRPPLKALPRSTAGPSAPIPMAPLPSSVLRHVSGRKQVIAAADPDRPYDPDEITGEVPIQPELPDEAPDPDEVTGETAGVRAAQDAAHPRDLETANDPGTASVLHDPPESVPTPSDQAVSGRAVAQPTNTSDWDDIISEHRGPAAIARMAARGLTDEETDQLVTRLASGLPGIQRAAAALAAATAEARTYGPLVELMASDHAHLRAAAATALGAIGDPSALGVLEAARADEDPGAAAAAEEAIALICGWQDDVGEE